MLSQDSANERSSLVKRSSSSLRALTSGASSDKQVLSSQVLSFLSAKSLVFGSIDGVITGLTVFSSLQQITTSSRTIIAVVVGCCLADAISICIGQVLSQRQLEEEVKSRRASARWHLLHYRKPTMEKLVNIYIQRGVAESDARRIVDTLSKYPEAFLDGRYARMRPRTIGVRMDYAF